MRGKYFIPVIALGIAQSASAVYLVDTFNAADYTPQNSTKTVELSTVNATDGSTSMRINDLTGGWAFVVKRFGADVYDEWFKNTTMLIDVYFPSRTAYQQIQFALFTNSGNGYDQKELVSWKWLNAGQGYTATIEWDYSALVDPNVTSSTWIDFGILAAVPGTGATRPLDIYVDNLRLTGAPVPEPMTMIALGGGLLAVAARRRRK